METNGIPEDLKETIVVAGMQFFIAEQIGTAVLRICSPRKLSAGELKAAVSDLMRRYETIQFATVDAHERGEEYASWTAGMFFDFARNEIIPKDKYFR